MRYLLLFASLELLTVPCGLARANPAELPPIPDPPAVRIYREKVSPHWFAGGTQFWYRITTGKQTHAFVQVHAEQGTVAPAFDHAKLSEALRKAGIKDANPERLSLENLQIDQGRMEFTLSGKQWRCDLSQYQLSECEPDAGQSAAGKNRLRTSSRASRRTGSETELTFLNQSGEAVELFWLDSEGTRRSYGSLRAGESRAQHTFAGHVWLVLGSGGRELALVQANDDPNTVEITGERVNTRPKRDRPRGRPDGTSPDGRFRAMIREHNVSLQNVATGETTALSRDGTTGDAYSGRVYWSPDSKTLVVLRTKAGAERKVQVVESSPSDQLQPKVSSFEYLKPGDQIAISKPHLFDVETRCEIPVSDESFPNPWSISELRWEPDSARFTFLYNQRGHQLLRVIAVEAATGKTSCLINEESRTFVDYAGKCFSEYLPESGEMLWMSERDGWNHLYLFDLRTGRLKNQVTKGEWVVRDVDYVDKAKRQVWFRAGGIRSGQDPYYVHYARVNFDGTGLVVLTEGNGNHSVQFSPDRRYLVDTWSRVDLAPINELRRSNDGSLVCTLERADTRELQAADWKPPRPFVAKGRDGRTDIYGILHFPPGFDRNKKYPVLESIYAGPQAAFVPKSFQVSSPPARLAASGFIIAQIDGMGTSHRSKAFHDVCWKNLGDAGLPDRIAWLKAVAKEFPAMDLSRVGIYGTSAGGQSALRALLAHGDFYKAAVADSGCHDNRMDKIWWNELWMGWPVGPHYEEQSNVTNAKLLQGKLLLMVGELDRNVDPASTMQVVNALVRANKHFELLVVPGGGHGILGTSYGQARLQDFFLRSLQ